MALASAASRVGGGAKIADFWRIAAGFDPIPEGTQPRATGRAARAISPRCAPPGRWPAANSSGPDAAIAGRLPVAGGVGQLATGSGPVCLGHGARGMARRD